MDGRLTITDAYTGQVRPTAVRLRPEETPSAVAVSDDLFRVAAALGTTLVMGDTTMHGHTISVHLAPVASAVWLDDDTLVAQVGARGLVAVDASRGAIAQEPAFPFDVGAFGLLQRTT